MIIILIILILYLYLYFKPYIDQDKQGNYLLWYNKKVRFSVGTYKNERRWVYLKQFNPFI